MCAAATAMLNNLNTYMSVSACLNVNTPSIPLGIPVLPFLAPPLCLGEHTASRAQSPANQCSLSFVYLSCICCKSSACRHLSHCDHICTRNSSKSHPSDYRFVFVRFSSLHCICLHNSKETSTSTGHMANRVMQ